MLDHALFTGGKRIRPLLTLLAASLVKAQSGCDHSPVSAVEPASVARLAIAFEYLHAASLLHDDVIDRAGQRRGRATVNARWDQGTAILAGNFLHVRAVSLVGNADGGECLELVAVAIQAMVAAEFAQMDASTNHDWRQSTYFAVLRGKTAALIAAACESGVVIADGRRQQRQALRAYGVNLGLAFQVIDDLLDYLGEPGVTGKALGNDLREGKMTLPLLIAHQQATPTQRLWLEEQIMAASPAQRGEQFSRVRELLTVTGAFASCRAKAEELIAEGLAALTIFPAGPEQIMLSALGQYVLERKK